MNSTDPVLAPMSGAEHREIGGIEVDTVDVGAARVKRMIYPVGFRWSTHIKPIVGTDLCMHAHVGFLARGQIHVQYADGCTVELKAPQGQRQRVSPVPHTPEVARLYWAGECRDRRKRPLSAKFPAWKRANDDFALARDAHHVLGGDCRRQLTLGVNRRKTRKREESAGSRATHA